MLAGLNLSTRCILEPNWRHVGAELKHVGVESRILWILKSRMNSSGNWNRFSKIFEAVQSSLKAIPYLKLWVIEYIGWLKLRWLQSAMLGRFGVVLEGHFDHARANVTHYRARGCQKTGDTHTRTQTLWNVSRWSANSVRENLGDPR